MSISIKIDEKFLKCKSVDVRDVLRKVNVDIASETDKDYIVRCINSAHKDRHPSLRICKVSGLFHCYPCGTGGDIVKFVSILMGINREESFEYIFGESYSMGEIEMLKSRLNSVKEDLIEVPKLQEYKIPKAAVLADTRGYGYHHNIMKLFFAYLKGRGISTKTITAFNVMGVKDIKGALFILFPVVVGGKCIGTVKRSIKGKVFLNSKRFPMKYVLYNVDRVKSGKPVVLTESIFNVLRTYQAGYTAVGILGSVWNEYKCSLLIRRKPSRFIFFYDRDSAGIQLFHKAAKDLLSFGSVSVVSWDHMSKVRANGKKINDAADLTEKEVKMMILNAKTVNRYEEWDSLRERLVR